MVLRRTSWKQTEPLYRGDVAGGVQAPDPKGPRSIVRHITYQDGAGRSTPYLSVSESRDAAQYFAGSGRVYRTNKSAAGDSQVQHLSRAELLGLLKGRGQGDAAGSGAYQVAKARQYVEQWQEHLLDFAPWATRTPAQVRAGLDTLFT